jgi:hypothetical protein
MRIVLAVLLLAACGRASAGPAWPKMAQREDDGGESLAPRAKASAVAAAAADDDKPAKADDKPAAAAAKPDAETTKPASTVPTQVPDDIVITTEELVIEIED